MALQGVIQAGKVYLQKGRLRHRIEIVQPVLNSDCTGGWTTDNVTPVMKTWASIEALTASEKFAAKQFASQVTHRVIIRDPRSAAPRIVSSMQIRFTKNGVTRQFQIEGVLSPDERPDALVLVCVELNDSNEQTAE